MGAVAFRVGTGLRIRGYVRKAQAVVPGRRAGADGLPSNRAKRCERDVERAAKGGVIALSETRADWFVPGAIPADGEGSVECGVLGGKVGAVV